MPPFQRVGSHVNIVARKPIKDFLRAAEGETKGNDPIGRYGSDEDCKQRKTEVI